MAAKPPWLERTHALVNQGRVEDAISELERAGAAGDPGAFVELAAWYMQGSLVGRSLTKSRACFALAAEHGNAQARMIHASLVGNGTGGPRDWPAAVRLLELMATDNEDAARQLQLIRAMDLTEQGEPKDLPDRRSVSDRPEIAWFDNLFTDDECNYLIGAATRLLKPSVVVDPESGKYVPHPIRTSDGAAFPWASEVPVIHALNRRLAAASQTDEECGEPLQILRYRPGEQYRPHHDAVTDDNQRIVTMLVYLNADYVGGETSFIQSGLKLRGKTGDALFFRNADGAGRPDPAALHAGLPVTEGEKLLASRWIRQRAFGPDRLT